MKRGRVRTRVLGAGWEERFLEAVRKARERKLVPPEAAEKLRRFAGVYFCARCRKDHRTESALGRKHLRLQPAPQKSNPQPLVARAPAGGGAPGKPPKPPRARGQAPEPAPPRREGKRPRGVKRRAS